MGIVLGAWSLGARLGWGPGPGVGVGLGVQWEGGSPHLGGGCSGPQGFGEGHQVSSFQSLSHV